MWPFKKHKHHFKIVRTVVAKGIGTGRLTANPFIYSEPERNEAQKEYIFGITTYVWKCDEPTCDKIITEECLGEEYDLTSFKKALG